MLSTGIHAYIVANHRLQIAGHVHLLYSPHVRRHCTEGKAQEVQAWSVDCLKLAETVVWVRSGLCHGAKQIMRCRQEQVGNMNKARVR